ncbi:hypothetical protein [Helicobacter typhlonius]|uniref:hypothetical protein n=1 Tax=Helicobacter typhlonius TaxID=76936 RepID=UPI00261A0BFC|nr:hypothetical protein [uncultured Helicobacter sp.]
MSNEMPKEATLAQSKEDLASEVELQKIKQQNEKAREVIEYNNLLKKQDDSEAILHNAKILNDLSKNLVSFFFKKLAFIGWVVVYIALNICFHYHLGEKASFYIGLIDKIGLFIIVCILGKFLKDNLSLFIEMLKK